MPFRHALFHEKVSPDMKGSASTLLIVIFILALGYHAVYTPPCFSEPNTITHAIQRQKGALRKITREIHEKKAKLKEIRGEEEKIIESIERLNQRINHHWALLQEKKEEREEIEGRISAVANAIQSLQARLKRQQKFIELRLRALWEFGPLGILNVIFSSRSIGELYSRQRYLLSILQKDQANMKQFMASIEDLQRKKEVLNKEKKLLLKVEKEIEAEAMQLEEAVETKKLFLEDLKTQEQGYEMLVASLKSTEESINHILKQLKSEAQHQKKLAPPTAMVTAAGSQENTHKGGNIEANLGRLTPPIIGAYRIITPNTDPRVPQNGIILESEIGAPVRAIFDGTVKFIGPVKGFGTVIILDHGHGYMSLMGYLARVFVPLGKEVFEGETIGIAGPAGLVDAGVYLEVRKEGRPVDPLTFIDTRGITIE